MECGKDVYCQKPLTLDIDEGKKLVDTARRYGTVFQTGSQQRSDDRFRLACALARSGVIGTLQRVNTHIDGVDAGEWQKPTTPPPELDWEMWLGPAPYAEYVPNRVHYQFRWFADYSRRQAHRLGRPPQRHRPMGDRRRRFRPGESPRQRQVP